MPIQNHNRGIWQYWQPLVGMATFLIAGGIFYNKVESAFQKLDEIEKRQDRQLELYQSLDKRVNDQEKSREYYRGVRDGRAEVGGVKKAE